MALLLAFCAVTGNRSDAQVRAGGAVEPRLMPIYKIRSADAVESAVNFGQVKIGARFPDLSLRHKYGGGEVQLHEILQGHNPIVCFYRCLG